MEDENANFSRINYRFSIWCSWSEELRPELKISVDHKQVLILGKNL